ncbi:vacuolar protein sorting-associated protein 41 [Thraustotheca clavata]|uniref:Vacuolar protein sorting-associated protein 41 n=1 Tax=Thraustotheca clavata TaxID=74557 RepID=A0A1V9YI15_9STRA|nr:vacuolar protein sorting-associated protein 41 [Thraustotheca clavata]
MDVSEPVLKYERLGGHFQTLFRDDALSCMTIHLNFLCAGTYEGHVLLLELNGRYVRRLHKHHKKVQEISIDETGQHIVSCSDDGTVAVYALQPVVSEENARVAVPNSGGEVNIYNFYSAIYSAQLEDGYASKRERTFACGGISGQLILNKKGWIIDKENTIHEGEGPVHCIRYHENLIAWANDWGVKVYDTSTDSRITYIERPQNCPPFELCHAHLVWHSSATMGLVLLVGWGATLRVIKISMSSDATNAAVEAKPQSLFGTLTAEVVSFLTFDFFVAGLSPWGDSAAAILAYRSPGSTATSSFNAKERGEGKPEETHCPEVHLISFEGKQLAVDVLAIKGYERLRASDYCLPSVTFDGQRVLYICSPKDVVLCRTRDVDDRVAYALSTRSYENALQIALTDIAGLKKHALDELVEYYLGELILSKEFTKAAETCQKLLSGHLWEKYVYVFAQKGALGAIAKYMPTSNPRLPTSQYEMVLKHFLETDPGQLLEIIRKWPKPRLQDRLPVASSQEYTETASLFEPLYDPEAWINQLETTVRRRRLTEVDHMSMETSFLMEALAELYTATEQYDHALRIYLSQGSMCSNKEHAFKLIVEHNLWESIQNKVVNLMLIDRDAAIRMLVHQIKSDELKVHSIVKQLEHKRELLHEYLHNLFVHRLVDYNTERYSSLHELQISLYAEFAPHFLLRFLQTSSFVPLEKAYKFCSERSPPLWDAMVFILGRMGQHKKALDFIMTQLKNVKQAIQFVQDNDNALWDYLIEISLTHKDFMAELLEYACEHKIDPIKVIKKVQDAIPEDMEITGLKSKVQQIITNYRIQMTLYQGCTKVFESDRIDLLRRLIAARKKPRRVTMQTQCGICLLPIKQPLTTLLPTGSKTTGHLCVFECGHAYHVACLEEKTMLSKQSESISLPEELGCFLCDHHVGYRGEPEDELNTKGLSESQLEVARATVQSS